jgi:diguanylate cyclase (GGDEF)-like protein
VSQHDDLVQVSDDQRRASFLGPVLVFTALATIPMYLALRWTDAAPPAAAALGVLVGTLACWFALRAGHQNLAVTGFGFVLLLGLVVPPATSGNAGMSPYAASVVAGILLLSTARRFTVATVVVILLATGALWLVTNPAATPDLGWRQLIIGSVVITSLTVAVVTSGMRGIGRSLTRLQEATRNNAEIQNELESLRAGLDAAVERRAAEIRAVIDATEADIRALDSAAMRDSLTGLFNRRHLEGPAGRRVAQALADGVSTSLGVLDIDEFKSINDEISHAQGDEVLVHAAAAMVAAAGEDAVVHRLGGDEFLVLMFGADPADGKVILDRISRAVSAADWQGATPTGRLSLTWGAAPVSDGTAEGLRQAIAAADQALLAAKRKRGVRR